MTPPSASASSFHATVALRHLARRRRLEQVCGQQLSTGISGSVEEVHQLSRPCRLFSLASLSP